MRLVVAGTPRVALPSLEALVGSDRHEVVAVLTRPDARAGRGRHLTPSPLKERALELGLEVLTPRRPSDPEFLSALRDLAPDCCPVIAYGALVPREALDIPAVGWVNLHFSILPAWRGAAPVQHAIRAGDDLTGASTFLLEEGLDTGPVFGVMTTSIGPRDTAGELLDRLAVDGAGLLTATLDGIADGTVTAVPQPEEGVSLAPRLRGDDARVDWSASAIVVDRLVRACTPAPGAWTTLRQRRVGLGPVVPLDHDLGLEVGELRDAGSDGVVVGTRTGPVRLGVIRPAGRPRLAATEWVRGLRLAPGEQLE
jgi:methionyl-tRNA formyltransferase